MGVQQKAWVAALMLLSAAAVVRADSIMWWTVDSISGPNITAQEGTDQEGANLVVEKGPLEPGEFFITLILNARVIGTPLKGYSLSLFTDIDNPIEIIDAQDLTGLPVSTPGTFGSPPQVMTNFGQTDLFGFGLPAGYDGPLMSIQIKVIKEPDDFPVDLENQEGIKIYGAIGEASSWDDDADMNGDPIEEFATFGDNPMIPVGAAAGGTSTGPNPLITIINVPEPGTVAFFGLAAVSIMLRRRRERQ